MLSICIKCGASPKLDICSGMGTGYGTGTNDMIYIIRKSHLSLFVDDCILNLDGNNWNQKSLSIVQDRLQIKSLCTENGFRMNAARKYV